MAQAITLFFALALLAPTITQAASDKLASTSFTFTAGSPDSVVEDTVSDLRDVFRRYKPAFDSGTKVVRPLKVSGSASHPSINMEVRKCVLFICKNVELDASISLREVNGSCRRNYVLKADLARSSETLTEQYKSLTVNICYNANGKKGQAQLDGFADRASTYDGGMTTNEILKMLKLQVEPMTKALEESIRAKGGRSLVFHQR